MEKRVGIKGKKAIELAIGTIVILVLALFVLIALFLIFSNASGNFKETIINFLGGSNVDNVIINCNNLAEQNLAYEYCCVKKSIKLNSGRKLSINCFEARNETWGLNIAELNCEGVC